MEINFKSIPNEMREKNNWIFWRYEDREGKKTKVPYQATGEMAKSNDFRTWHTFTTVKSLFKKRMDVFEGVGFMFSQEDNLIGIDIDHCINEDGELNDIAQEIRNIVGDTYAEISPSGHGLHFIISVDDPAAFESFKNATVGLEVYKDYRYFTVTGHKFGGDEIVNHTDALLKLMDQYKPKKAKPVAQTASARALEEYDAKSDADLLEQMFNSRQGAKICDLYNGVLIDGDHSSSDIAFSNFLAFWTNCDFARMDGIFRNSGLYREKWDKVHSSDGRTYGAMTLQNSIDTCSKTIGDYLRELKDNQPHYDLNINFNEMGVAAATPGESKTDKPGETENAVDDQERPNFMLSELGNAERIAWEHGENVKYCVGMDWLLWNGKKWERDTTKKIERITAQTLRKLFEDADACDDPAEYKKILKWANRCESRSTRVNSIADLKPILAKPRDDFDKDDYLFNCANGIVDLRTGELCPHDKSKYITQISPVEYDPNAKCPTWEKFLTTVFVHENGEPDNELIGYMQKLIGYTLTGSTKEQSIYFLYGNGSNGKSTFIDAINKLMGEYASTTNTETFIKKNNDSGVNNDIARLTGARYVSASESEDGQQLSESLVKQITGGDKITARFLRQEFFEFTPKFKIFFMTNNKPIIKGSDNGIWRRIKLIPFVAEIPDEKKDRTLGEKLQKELPGILLWAIKGCQKWLREGLTSAEAVAKASNEYREEMDVVQPFINECCTVGPGEKIEAKKLYESYANWAFENKELELHNRQFYKKIVQMGYKKRKGAKNKTYFFGITLAGLAKQKNNAKEAVENGQLFKFEKNI